MDLQGCEAHLGNNNSRLPYSSSDKLTCNLRLYPWSWSKPRGKCGLAYCIGSTNGLDYKKRAGLKISQTLKGLDYKQAGL